MIECKYYTKEKEKIICNLCPHQCHILENKSGICKVRINNKGVLKSLNYSKLTAVALDNIEKKPLYHFYPGEQTISFGSFGCNFSCEHCQNYDIANTNFAKYDDFEVFPDMVGFLAESKNSKIVSYTYNEPTVYYEFVLESSAVAKKHGLKNVLVTNGFINKKPLLELCNYIDAANVDLKSFSNNFYKDICSGKLEPVLETIKTLVEKEIHVEITYLIIPELNDSDVEIANACEWIINNIGKDIPLHFTRFFPMFKMTDKQPTPISTLEKAYTIAKNAGLKYVYLGNVNSKHNNTFCPKCNNKVIERDNGNIINHLREGKCKCGEKIYGKY